MEDSLNIQSTRRVDIIWPQRIRTTGSKEFVEFYSVVLFTVVSPEFWRLRLEVFPKFESSLS